MWFTMGWEGTALVENPFGDDRVLVSGRFFTAEELQEVRDTIRMFPRLSRTELALTLCENLSWFTAGGGYKVDSARQLLNKLESSGLVTLPMKQRQCKSPGNKSVLEYNVDTDPGPELVGSVGDFEPLEIKPVRDQEKMHLWNEYVDRYHVLGYRRPFGAHQRYFIISAGKVRLGCLLFSASAWALASRDRWIGWEAVDRSQRLHLILNNSRFLLFPWVHVRNLASKVLSLAAKQIRQDWAERYNYSPVLLETFVDKTLYKGTSYLAANWLCLGETAGRGRMDRHTNRQLTAKLIYVYPLVGNFRACLVGEGAGR